MTVVSADLSLPTVTEAFAFLIRLITSESRARLLEKLHSRHPPPHDGLVTI
jgi:hypothetical protein